MASSDDNQITSSIEWKKLEAEVNKAIEKKDASLVIFDSKNMEESKYQQKYVEVKQSDNNSLNSELIFMLGAGGGILSSSIGTNDPIYSLFLKIIGTTLLLLGYILYNRVWKPRNKIYTEIILKAEKRILSQIDAEPRTTQGTTNIPLQAQENVPSRSGNVGKIEYTKEKLNLFKLIMSATFLAMSSVIIYEWQSLGYAFNPRLFLMIVFGALTLYLGKQYAKTMDELKDMP